MNNRFISPLRYPGGKGGLFHHVSNIIKENSRAGGTYYEPFAGGGGCALRILKNGIAHKIVLNDADPCIYAFWHSALHETARFVDRIHSIDLSIETWIGQKELLNKANQNSLFELGFATFFINRCSRSGIISKSGPIGGYAQKGKWTINARFNREALAERVEYIGQMREYISISNLDAVAFMRKNFASRRNSKRFVYLDPPYYMQGGRLYFNTLDKSGHTKLSQYLQLQKKLKWIVTYDDHEFIKQLYTKCKKHKISLNYSLQNKTKSHEILYAPFHVEIPQQSMSC